MRSAVLSSTQWTTCSWILCLSLAVTGSPESVQADPPQSSDARKAMQDFDRRIAPLLARRCLECHSGATVEGGLDLTQRSTAVKGGDTGPALIPGQADQSLMWRRISAGEMPPETPLSEQERSLIRDWIRGGAVWGNGPIDRFQYSSDNRAGYDWWSLRSLDPPDPPSLPAGFDPAWGKQAIDRYVADRLDKAGLTPSKRADPRTLVRRLYHDLTGLPPEPGVIEKFQQDPSETAYRQLVEQLLASDHYGERWGRHWLDVVRFGESHGFERNAPRDHAWHYRDWVIRSLNKDMPYDQFVRMQLAGDLVDPDLEGVAAAGFLVSGVHNTVVGSSERMKRLARQDELEEVIGAIGQTFLGLTVNCSRCHDHKFDPITSREYYQMISAIDGIGYGDRQLDRPEIKRQRDELVQRRDAEQRTFSALRRSYRKRFLESRTKGTTDSSKPESIRPQPFALWEFDEDLRDHVGELHGEAVGGASLEEGMLVLDGKGAYVRTAALPKKISAKTLEAWVLIDGLDQRGGGVISMQTNDGNVFDAIVFGEREQHRWMAGSNVFARTKSFAGPAESEADREPVHIAVVYEENGTIHGYRNGLPYGTPYQTGFVSFEAGQSHVVFGLRHLPVGGNRMLKGKILRAALYDRALDAEAIAASAGRESDYVPEKALVASLKENERREYERQSSSLQELTQRIEQLQKESRVPVYTVTPRNPGRMKIHVRGSVTDFGDEVAPAGLTAVAGISPDFGLAADASDRDRRLQLARWVSDPENPLLSRVMVNRIWHYHFGTGLVETPNDLGFNGGRPSHPGLLDWLAVKFRGTGFRLKQLHREIVFSETYRQSSRPRTQALAVDAENRLLWRYAPRRIEAESLRDSILQVAGALNPAMYGPGFRDVSVTYNAGTTYYEPIDPDGMEFYRRTVYRFTPRGGRSAVLDTFDCPDPSSAAPRRSVTTTPLQALSLLNNSFVLRMSGLFAERVKRESGPNDDAGIQRAWNLALGRDPDPTEQVLSQKLVDRFGVSALCRALFNSNEFIVIE